MTATSPVLLAQVTAGQNQNITEAIRAFTAASHMTTFHLARAKPQPTPETSNESVGREGRNQQLRRIAMSHHSDQPIPDEFIKKLEDLDGTTFRGATGDYPEGKITESDEGAIQFAVGHDNGKVVLDFGTPVAWVGMNPQQAVELAHSLLEHARQCSDGVLTMKIG